MKIGDDTDFLEIVPTPGAGLPGIFRVRAAFADSLSEGAFRNDAVVFGTSPAVIDELDRFAALKQPTFAVAACGDGSIGLTRET